MRNFDAGDLMPSGASAIQTMPLAPNCLAVSVSASKSRRDSAAPPGIAQADDRAPGIERSAKDGELAPRERGAHVGQLEAEAQVGLVEAVARDRLAVGQAREGRQIDLHHLRPHVAHRRLHRLEHVFLRAERHLDVELRELRLPVGTQIFVAHAARDLHVAAEARDHQNLLEHLRRLRQRVERAGVQAAGNEIVARAFGRRLDDHRRLDLEEASRVEEVAHRLDDLVAHAEIALHARAPQIEIAVLQPQIFVDGLVAVDGKGWHLRAVEDLERVGGDLDVAGRQPRILRSRGTPAHGAGDAQHVFVAQVLGFGKSRVLRIEDDLGHALAIAQVDEDQAAVVAAPIDPACELHGLAGIAGAQRSARDLVGHYPSLTPET